MPVTIVEGSVHGMRRGHYPYFKLPGKADARSSVESSKEIANHRDIRLATVAECLPPFATKRQLHGSPPGTPAPPPQSSPIKPNQAQSSPIKPNQAQSSPIKPNEAQSSPIKPFSPPPAATPPPRTRAGRGCSEIDFALQSKRTEKPGFAPKGQAGYLRFLLENLASLRLCVSPSSRRD